MEEIQNAESLLAGESAACEYPRLPVHEEATLLLVNQGSCLPCRVVEISLTCCRLITLDRFLAGTLVRVEAAFKLRNVAFRFSGVVEWTDGKHDVDVSFTDVTPRRMEELVEVLCEQASENAAKAIKEAAKRLAAGEKTRKDVEARPSEPSVAAPRAAAPTAAEGPAENSRSPVGASKLALRAALQPPAKLPELATRQPAAPVESNRFAFPPSPAISQAGHPQPLTPLTEAAKPPANGSRLERRKQPRQQVDSWATIHLVNIASRLRGRILNLSLGGCSIRTEKCFPVGIYTRVETEFHFDGCPFRLGGVVQALPDRRNVGIRFLDMSERKREQVERLMAEIAQSREQQESIGTSTPGASPGEDAVSAKDCGETLETR
jgi:hypothetical protein